MTESQRAKELALQSAYILLSANSMKYRKHLPESPTLFELLFSAELDSIAGKAFENWQSYRAEVGCQNDNAS